jgi:hypothetical protein
MDRGETSASAEEAMTVETWSYGVNFNFFRRNDLMAFLLNAEKVGV